MPWMGHHCDFLAAFAFLDVVCHDFLQKEKNLAYWRQFTEWVEIFKWVAEEKRIVNLGDFPELKKEYYNKIFMQNIEFSVLERNKWKF